jgi:hypothetical protein
MVARRFAFRNIDLSNNNIVSAAKVFWSEYDELIELFLLESIFVS